MLGFLKKATNKLFEFDVPITRGAASKLITDSETTHIICYGAGLDEDKAKQATILRLGILRCVVHPGWKSREVDAKTWSSYVKTRWPRIVDQMPKQNEIDKLMAEGGAIVGPEPKNG